MKSQGVRNKRAGSDAERLYASQFRDLGFPLCQTARYASRLYDNSKIDLVNIPFNIQIKAGIQKNLSPGKELMLMDACIKSMFPEYDSVRTHPKLLIHHKAVGKGKKRTSKDSLVYMSLQQFNDFNSKLVKKLEYLELKEGKLQSASEFKDVVCISFDYFVKNVVKILYQNGVKEG